jgi:hypothetical protein
VQQVQHANNDGRLSHFSNVQQEAFVALRKMEFHSMFMRVVAHVALSKGYKAC